MPWHPIRPIRKPLFASSLWWSPPLPPFIHEPFHILLILIRFLMWRKSVQHNCMSVVQECARRAPKNEGGDGGGDKTRKEAWARSINAVKSMIGVVDLPEHRRWWWWLDGWIGGWTAAVELKTGPLESEHRSFVLRQSSKFHMYTEGESECGLRCGWWWRFHGPFQTATTVLMGFIRIWYGHEEGFPCMLLLLVRTLSIGSWTTTFSVEDNLAVGKSWGKLNYSKAIQMFSLK